MFQRFSSLKIDKDLSKSKVSRTARQYCFRVQPLRSAYCIAAYGPTLFSMDAARIAKNAALVIGCPAELV